MKGHIVHEPLQILTTQESGGGLLVSTQVRQSEGSGFKSRSVHIDYFHGVKNRFSTWRLVMFVAVRTPRKTVEPLFHKSGGHRRMNGEAAIATPRVFR